MEPFDRRWNRPAANDRAPPGHGANRESAAHGHRERTTMQARARSRPNFGSVSALGCSDLAVPNVGPAAARIIVAPALSDGGRPGGRGAASSGTSIRALARIGTGLSAVGRRQHAVQTLGQTDPLPCPSARLALFSRVRNAVAVGSSGGVIPGAVRRLALRASDRRIGGGVGLACASGDQGDQQERAPDHGRRSEQRRSPIAGERAGAGAGVDAGAAATGITAATCTSRRSLPRW
jgi:hypothetical protein